MCYILAHHLVKGQFPALEACRYPPQGGGRAGLLRAHGHCVLGKAQGRSWRPLLPSASLWLQTHRHGPPPRYISAHQPEQDKAKWPQPARKLEEMVPLLPQVMPLHAVLTLPEGENSPGWDPGGHLNGVLWM